MRLLLLLTLLALAVAHTALGTQRLQEIARAKIAELGLNIKLVDPDQAHPAARQPGRSRQLLFSSSPCPGQDPARLFAQRSDIVFNQLLPATSIFGDPVNPFPGPAPAYAYFDELGKFYTDDYIIDVPGGWVSHRGGAVGRAQYYMTSGSVFNMNWFNVSLASAPADSLSIAIEGDTFIIGARFPARFLGDNILVPEIYGGPSFTFAPCSSKIKYELLGPPAPEVIDHGVWLANYSRAQGTYDLCMHHEAYCVGGLRQYESFDACIAYVSALPAVSLTCGHRQPMAGNSKACRFVQKFSLPYQPEVQCPLIGPENHAPGRVECTDHSHCPRLADALPGLWSNSGPPPEFFSALEAYERFFDEAYDMAPLESGDFSSYKFFNGAPQPWARR